MGYGEKLWRHFEHMDLTINPVPKIKIEGLEEDSHCTGCKFFRTLEETIKADTIGWMNKNSGAVGFCHHPYIVDKMNSCAWVDFGCVNRREK